MREGGWVDLLAVLEAPFITRDASEAVLSRFAVLGFPDGEGFRLHPSVGLVRVSGWTIQRSDAADPLRGPLNLGVSRRSYPPMDKAAAISIANDAASTRFAGRLELLGVIKIDKESRDRFVEAEWQKGAFRIPGVAFEDVARVIGHRPCRPCWVINYLAYGPVYRGGITLASARVDDESGSLEWEIHPRPAH